MGFRYRRDELAELFGVGQSICGPPEQWGYTMQTIPLSTLGAGLGYILGLLHRSYEITDITLGYRESQGLEDNFENLNRYLLLPKLIAYQVIV